jgi:2-amino-4-hydroxy-6-hydroxymethyldihydropteridine diphosphokinase
MADVYLGLGSNLGDKQANLDEALRLLGALCRVIRVSPFYRTEPVGFLDQDWFLNAAAHVETGLRPAEFMALALQVETQMGRVRTVKDGPRIIDIDILLWDGEVIQEPGVTVPHPRMHERRFVLEPLNDIAPEALHPLLGATVSQLLGRLR